MGTLEFLIIDAYCLKNLKISDFCSELNGVPEIGFTPNRHLHQGAQMSDVFLRLKTLLGTGHYHKDVCSQNNPKFGNICLLL